ncbi:MAG: VWA domain-containing protein [Niabella sp.]
MSYQFQYPYFVWLFAGLVLLLLLFVFYMAWKKRVRRRMGDAGLIKKITLRYSSLRFAIKFLLISLAFGAGVLAVMGLRKPGGDDGIRRKGIDVVFALDVSRSMLAEDVKPTRLDKAKQLMHSLINEMPDNRVGLVLFAGKAYVQMPLTADRGVAHALIDDASPDIVPTKGTVISDALKTSLNIFGEREAKYKSVILISDGEDHDSEAMDVSKELETRGLMLNTVGLGSAQGSYIPDDSTGERKRDENGALIVSKLNEQELKQLAANTHGIYVHLENTADAVKKIKQQLSVIDKKVTGDTNLMAFQQYYWWFAGFMLLLLVLEQVLPEGRRKKVNE